MGADSETIEIQAMFAAIEMKAAGSPCVGDWCDMKYKSRWPSYGLCCKCRDKLPHRGCTLSSSFIFYFGSILFFSVVGTLFAWLAFSPYKRILNGDPVAGCQPDNEGSWSIGIYRGSSPFALQPIEMVSPPLLYHHKLLIE